MVLRYSLAHPHELVEVASIAELKHLKAVVSCFIDLVQLYHIWRIHFVEVLDFLFEILFVCNVREL